MEHSKSANRFSPEVRARAVRMELIHQNNYDSESAAIAGIAAKIGCIPETLRRWVRQAETDQYHWRGVRDGVTSEERGRIKALEREIKERARRTRSCAKPLHILLEVRARPPTETMISFIDERCNAVGVVSKARRQTRVDL